MLVDCGSCGGTGVYVGFAEKDGASVVCSSCKGTGAREFTAPPPFSGRKRREGVKTVASKNHGIVIAPGMDKGEVSYEDFVAGTMPTNDAGLYERYTGKPERVYE